MTDFHGKRRDDMSDTQETVAPEDFRELTELHDMASHACELLKAMANEWRLIILCQLSEGEKTVSELQNLLGLSQSALSQHLAVLRRCIDCENLDEQRMECKILQFDMARCQAEEPTLLSASTNCTKYIYKIRTAA